MSQAARLSTGQTSDDTPGLVDSPRRQPPQVSSMTEIRVSNGTDHHPCYIRRSFPKGKPERLVQGLTRLLSYDTPDTPDTPDQPLPSSKRLEGRWHLSSDGDAISRFTVLHDTSLINPLRRALRTASGALNHHPHSIFSPHPFRDPTTLSSRYCTFGVLCTTHVPHGLSLNDVKLADQIDEAIAKIQGEDSVEPPPELAEDELSVLKSSLETEAKIARADGARMKMTTDGEDVDDVQLYERSGITADARLLLEHARELEAKMFAVVGEPPP